MTVSAALPKDVTTALARLQVTLTDAGYASFEVEGIVTGAREKVEDVLIDRPDVATEDLVEMVEQYGDLDVPPEASSDTPSATSAKVGVGIALAAGAAMLLVPPFTGPDAGGSIMVLAALLAGPAAILLGRRARTTGLGQTSILLGGVIVAVPLGLIVLALLQVL